MSVIHWIKETSNHFMTRVYNMVLRMDPSALKIVPDDLKTQGMCNETVRMDPYTLRYVLDHLKTQEVCDEAVCREQHALRYVSDNLKTQEMCNKATCYKAAAFFLFLTILKHKKCAMRQCAWIHTT